MVEAQILNLDSLEAKETLHSDGVDYNYAGNAVCFPTDGTTMKSVKFYGGLVSGTSSQRITRQGSASGVINLGLRRQSGFPESISSSSQSYLFRILVQSFVSTDEDLRDEDFEGVSAESVSCMFQLLLVLERKNLQPNRLIPSELGGCVAYFLSEADRRYASIWAYNDGSLMLTLHNPDDGGEEDRDFESSQSAAVVDGIISFLNSEQ